MRLVRLLVACLAFVLAHPASAVPGKFDGIVLVASHIPSESEPPPPRPTEQVIESGDVLERE
jgi:hypothetical protein